MIELEGSFERLDKTVKLAFEFAEFAMNNAYCPYSKFHVGACLVPANDDEIYIAGANVENISFGLTICAERSALFRAVAMGYRNFKQLVIITKRGKTKTIQPSFPCGACRQVLYEFQQRDKPLEIFTANSDLTKINRSILEELLPYSFNASDIT